MAKVKARAPDLTKLQKQQRLVWAREHRHWTISDWEKVIFSDDTKLLCVNPSGRALCWRTVGDRSLGARVVKPTKKFGGGSLMIMGMHGSKRGGKCMSHLTTMEPSVYIEILRDHMRPSAAWLLPHPGTTYFLQQDNDRKHTSRETCAWPGMNHVATLRWPSRAQQFR